MSLSSRFVSIVIQTLSVNLCASLLSISSDQNDSPYQSDSAKNGRQWYRFVFIGGGVNRTDVDYIFMLGVADTLVHEGQHPKHYQRQSNQRSTSHSGASKFVINSVLSIELRSARNVSQQRQNEQNDEDIEKDFGDAGRGESDTSKTKNCRHQGHNKKDQRPAQHD